MSSFLGIGFGGYFSSSEELEDSYSDSTAAYFTGYGFTLTDSDYLTGSTTSGYATNLLGVGLAVSCYFTGSATN